MDRNEAIAKYNNKVEKILNQEFWNYKSKQQAYSDIEKKEIYTDPDEAYEESGSVYENIIKI